MNHWIVMPVALPLLAAALALLLERRRRRRAERLVAIGATLAQLVIAGALLAQTTDGGYQVYAIGDWPPPFGIVLVLDRLAALMLALTGVLAVVALAHALAGADRAGRHFHALFQLQLMGLNGAYLTGDLFNLFVFFEILLIASFGLLLYSGGPERSRAALRYVTLNLVGSALLLTGVAVCYGITGTLNLAHLAARAAELDAPRSAWLGAAGGLLLAAFALKAALVPLHGWLPRAYPAAAAPVAALFAIMTKVGIYAILRVATLLGAGDGGIDMVWVERALLALAFATLIAGALGTLASDALRGLVAYLTVLSVGTLTVSVAVLSVPGVAAGLFYLMHTTLVTAALFLIAHLTAHERGTLGDRLEPGAALARRGLLGALFAFAGAAIVGLPPFSGFLGKLMILQATAGTSATPWIWTLVLATSLLALVAVARAGSTLFWKTGTAAPPAARAPGVTVVPAASLLGASVLLVVLAAPASELAHATAAQVLEPDRYIEAVLDARTALAEASP